MIEILSPSSWDAMRRAGQADAATLAHVGSRIRPRMTTRQIDRLVRSHTASLGGRPSQLGYRGFPAAVCTSPNDVVCHGIPSPRVVLREGDIVNVDVTTELQGFHGDTSRTFFVGTPSPEAAHVVDVAERCLAAGIGAARLGGRLGDIGAAIEELARSEGCAVVRDYGGHGIGRKMHMDPHVSHVGPAGRGPRLRPGMAFTIEPMVTLGGARTRLLADGWTVVTADGSLTAQCEHTVLVTESGVEVLTVQVPVDHPGTRDQVGRDGLGSPGRRASQYPPSIDLRRALVGDSFPGAAGGNRLRAGAELGDEG